MMSLSSALTLPVQRNSCNTRAVANYYKLLWQPRLLQLCASFLTHMFSQSYHVAASCVAHSAAGVIQIGNYSRPAVRYSDRLHLGMWS